MTISVLALAATLALTVAGQSTCENYGVPNECSGCLCPPGFGGDTCAAPACGGIIFDGPNRPVVALSSPSDFGNTTAAGCKSEHGWTGTGGNLCTSAAVCQAGFLKAFSEGLVSPENIHQAEDLTCNVGPRVYAAGFMSCPVIHPLLQETWPGETSFTILRTVSSDSTPIANVTSFGSDNSIYTQTIYNGVEQYYCDISECTQDVTSGGSGSSSWNCDKVKCTCRTGTDFCGGSSPFNLTDTINALTGPWSLACGTPNSSNGTTHCSFKNAFFQEWFGADGLLLDTCKFGECVSQQVIDAANGF